jgi:glucose dehydrogenase
MNHNIRMIGAITYCTLVTLAFGVTVFLLYFREIPQTQRDYALVLLGALIASFKDVGSYWTGSTASSQTKDATIAGFVTPSKS